MEDGITKEDLRQFGLELIRTIGKLIDKGSGKDTKDSDPQWVRSRVVRKQLDISAGSLQNLRVMGKIRFKKVLGSYYYSRPDMMRLFNDDPKPDESR